jgi:hypothetical protein
MGTATNDSIQTSPVDAAAPASSRVSQELPAQPHDQPIITRQIPVVAPTTDEFFDGITRMGNVVSRENPGATTARHLGRRPNFLKRVFGWLI